MKPVILSTRAHGRIKIKSHPFPNFYNDVICYAKTDSISLLLDATEPFLPYYALPSECLNDEGFIVAANDSSWVKLNSQLSSTIWKTMIIKFSPDCDSINCAFTIRGSGYSGSAYRKDWDDGYEKFSSMLTNEKGVNITDSIKVYSKDDLELPFTIVYKASISAMKQKADSTTKADRIVFSPFLSEGIQDNPLKMAERKYPVDMEYKRSYKYQAMIEIPAGIKSLKNLLI